MLSLALTPRKHPPTPQAGHVEAAGHNKTERPKPSQPLLSEWPEGYTAFRLDGEDVVLLGEGKPPLRIVPPEKSGEQR
jgi:hypothetical protein